MTDLTLLTTDDWQLASYDYHLPDELIARYPLPERQASRMMTVDVARQTIRHEPFAQIGQFLNPGDLLVLNNTKVLPLRLLGHRLGRDSQPTTGKVEALLLTPLADQPLVWEALIRPAKKHPGGTVILLDPASNACLTVLRHEGEGRVQVAVDPGTHQTVEALLDAIGHMPIPPYFRRQAEALDKERYQTVFSRYPGSQAAPTAGLHFTPEILGALRGQGVQIAEVTLTVGIGTFRGVQVEDIRQHVMHGETFTLPEETARLIRQTREAGGRIIAVGTTVAKTLETAAQWQDGSITGPCEGTSELFIYPGFEWRVIDGLLTNFHLPKSSLLMLVSSLAGRELMLRAYQEAVGQGYRFFSYGDCMLIER